MFLTVRNPAKGPFDPKFRTDESLDLLLKLSRREDAACRRPPVVIAVVDAPGRLHLALRLLRLVILHFIASHLVECGGSSRLGFKSGSWRLVVSIVA